MSPSDGVEDTQSQLPWRENPGLMDFLRAL
jgi:hypothetical protein